MTQKRRRKKFDGKSKWRKREEQRHKPKKKQNGNYGKTNRNGWKKRLVGQSLCCVIFSGIY
jgi:hypothetical protein